MCDSDFKWQELLEEITSLCIFIYERRSIFLVFYNSKVLRYIYLNFFCVLFIPAMGNLLSFGHERQCEEESGTVFTPMESCSVPVEAIRRIEPPIRESNGPPNHECYHGCIATEGKISIEKFSLFHRPLAVGFEHKMRSKSSYYISPCGCQLRTYSAIREYLANVNSVLHIDSFSLCNGFNPSESRSLPYKSVEVISEFSVFSIDLHIILMLSSIHNIEFRIFFSGHQ